MSKKINLLYSLFMFSLIWIIIDGVFRKWIFPEFSTPIFALKYGLFGFSYLLFLLKTNFNLPKYRHFYQLTIVLLIIWCITLFFYSAFPTSILVKFFGLINYVFFIPLLLLVPYYFDSIARIEGMIKLLAYLSIPIFIVGIMQYFLPPDDILNYLPNKTQKFNLVANYTRSPSIFSFVKIYNVYLLFVLTTFTSYTFYLINKGRSSWFYLILLGLGTLNVFMTGSRLPVAITLVYTVIIFFYIFFRIDALRKTILVSVLIGISISAITYNFSTTVNTAVDAFLERAEFVEVVAEKGVENYSAKDRIIEKITIFKYAEQAGFLGFGIGTTYQGTGGVLSNFRSDLDFEEEGERNILEIGIIGGILLILLRMSILLYAISRLLKIKDVSYALLIIPFVLYLIPSALFLSNVTFNYLDGFSYWFAFSLVIAISKIYHSTLSSKE